MLNRRVIWTAASLLLPILASPSALANTNYPNGPVTMVVPYGAGGGTDFFARIIASKMSENLGKAVVVENKPGAGSAIAASDVARSLPDGQRILMGDLSTFATNSFLYKNLSYNPQKDFSAVTLVARSPYVLAVNPKIHPEKNFADLIAKIKAAPPEKFNYGSAGVGGPAHLSTIMMEKSANIKLVHIPFKGSGPAIPSLLNGDVGMIFTLYASVKPYLESGRIRVIGVAAPSSLPELKDVSQISQVLPGYESWFWFGFAVPKNTPEAIIKRIREAYAYALDDPLTRKKLMDSGFEPLISSSQEMLSYISSEMKVWGAVIQESKISLD
jgi:tripartite-type tricarboxylate transporter receptor subunit TctC